MMLTSRSGKPIPVFTSIILAINIIVFIAQWFLEEDQSNIITMIHWGANFSPYTLGSEWWRIFTSAFLHFGILHLVMNMMALYSLGRAVEAQTGSLIFCIVYFISALFAGVASLFWNLYVVSAGASGAIFGLYGFEIAIMVLIHWRNRQKLRAIIVQFVIYVVIITLLGNAFHFDNAAHFGGLIAGIILALFYAYSMYRRKINYFWITGVILTLLGSAYFILLPREKKEYFDVFQQFVKTERQSNNIMNGEYASDAVFVKDLKEYYPHWDTLLWKIDSLQNLPSSLMGDYEQIKNYSHNKASEMDFMIKMIEKESYVYFDSLDIVRSKMSLDLEYPLAMESVVDEAPAKSNITAPRSSGSMTRQYYDSNWHETMAMNASYYRLGYQDSLGKWNGPVRDYFLDGGIQMKGSYKNDLKKGVFLYYTKDSTYSAAGRYDNEERIGKWEEFHKNGKMAEEIRYSDRAYLINAWDEKQNPQVIDGFGNIITHYENEKIASFKHFSNGLQDSISYGFYENGKPYFKEYFESGRLMKGIAYDEKGQLYNYDFSTYIPYPEGGTEKFQKYLEKSLSQYQQLKGKGVVELIFDIDTHGKIYNVRIYKSDDADLHVTAINILKNGPRWVPAKEHGINPLISQGYQAIHF
ncbi:rhomboid family intramembrane serine protease [Fulvivirga sediminis]|uniref:Rhomboid family intramembrane serine protease n=1 Tax=Fulvivirga sediminis TaxID=2803949 RepID=A0A937F5R9_9BACT|nr:rhomboid family intramembrane serine protease [Fulvivirga sediminis]MBL3654528.1 rhomboid family intramembrane serine protease [Fulvivirga sediminis]